VLYCDPLSALIIALECVVTSGLVIIGPTLIAGDDFVIANAGTAVFSLGAAARDDPCVAGAVCIEAELLLSCAVDRSVDSGAVYIVDEDGKSRAVFIGEVARAVYADVTVEYLYAVPIGVEGCAVCIDWVKEIGIAVVAEVPRGRGPLCGVQ